MALTVNTNVASLNAQRNLGSSSSSLQTSLERLSSGSRINSAKDDAAGLQISNRLTSQIRGLGVAVKNANDGISLAQTAEGALQESTSILQRMRDLALQAANGGNGDSERKALNDEMVQLKNELDRISTTTKFGSKSLFDGSFSENIQVGAQANETISVKIDSFRTTDLGTKGSRDATAASLVAGSAPASLTVGAGGASTAASVQGVGVAQTNFSTTAVEVVGTEDLSGGGVIDISNFNFNSDVTTTATGSVIRDVDFTYGSFSSVSDLVDDFNQQITTNYGADPGGNLIEAFDDGNGHFGVRLLNPDAGADLLISQNFAAFAGLPTSIISPADQSSSLSIDLGGTSQTITLDQQYADAATMANAIQTQINGGSLNGLVTVSESGGVLSLQQTGNLGGETLAVTGAAADAVFGAGRTETPGTGGSVGGFTLALGTGTAQTINIDQANYTTLESLADNINQQIANNATLVGEVRATVSEGKLQFVTTDKGTDATITLGALAGNSGLTDLGFTDGATASGLDEGARDTSVEQLDITTAAGAQAAISTIDAALSEIDVTRASLGAIQNRFDSTISNLQNVAENASAARGRIQDTDYAAETANLTKNQILQQAGTAILAQANQLPQAVLSLLG
ncbi:flagellin [Halopseudomonas sp.]|uniref:flagellin N-terminal helical domain-containing protein n=1 Tax=Halopseudomonas sp. TaxID=2901191 RepID=UPI00311F0D60